MLLGWNSLSSKCILPHGSSPTAATTEGTEVPAAAPTNAAPLPFNHCLRFTGVIVLQFLRLSVTQWMAQSSTGTNSAPPPLYTVYSESGGLAWIPHRVLASRACWFSFCSCPGLPPGRVHTPATCESIPASRATTLHPTETCPSRFGSKRNG